jgi:molybdopterin-containing oxidoreductase family iron-sulfur binding subunit
MPTETDKSLKKLARQHGWSRKDFLKVTGLAAFAAAVTGAANAQGIVTSSTRQRRYGMVIDLQRCIACRACTVACKQENKTPPGGFYTYVSEQETGQYPKVKLLNIPAPCFHCSNPPCVPACPIEATWKRKEDGIVVVDYDKCQGIGACVDACPYGKRFMDTGLNYHTEPNEFDRTPSPEYKQNRVREAGKPPIGKARKCTFCLHKQDEQGNYTKLPACVETCMGKAIHFGDFNDPASELNQLLKTRKSMRIKEELGTQPNVYYLI